ncbi:2-oxoglutarate oxidoreductase subunit KorB [Candidatus Thermoflexus japonica]|uniref:2-oxoglutarate oxidoreductase subunit KorB n=1 Tax=Candidatus Thermoflexus japonica TaxID=2035417 RepID=A0A2H5Y5B1_9CHLR|nr:2-oxoglutarate oxidoreductase subunit KorB [Candidatus Thermoflexus japonica]
MSIFLTRPDLPFCKGCGHHHVVRSTVKALEEIGVRPTDVILVTDIGCHGIVDGNFATHTVHGLHGRSVALAAGIAMGLPPGKKVIVYIGDGGATLGLQHLLEAARMNVDLTVVVHNNMLYGMTGGQPSSLTPRGFRTGITPDGVSLPHHDLCRLVYDAGAAYVARVLGLGDFSETLRQALEIEGFTLVEVLELCTSYGVKWNPGLRLKALAEEAGYTPGVWTRPPRPVFRLPAGSGEPLSPRGEGLLDLPPVEVWFSSPLEERWTMILSGSAGEGIQQAAEILARAAMAAGLHVTKKGSYPVTVGVGFSTAEVILSRSPIFYHGVHEPDALVITSMDGLRNQWDRIERMTRGVLWVDASLPVPETGAEIRVRDFRGRAGARYAALYAIWTVLRETGVLPPEALLEVVRGSPLADRIPVDRLASLG